jgi:hypothetical protein
MSQSKPLCLVIMPFRPKFNPVLAAIRHVAGRYGLTCLRADEAQRAGSVMQMVIGYIEKASLVIADLTDRNANVFYETAIAHVKKDPHRVILIAQKSGDVPFDLRALRYIHYRNDPRGRALLKKQIGPFIEEGLGESTGLLFETIKGKIERTRRLVAEAEALQQAGPSVCSDLIIRVEAALSCFSVSRKEVEWARGGEEVAYRRLLLEEKAAFVKLLHLGAKVRAILSPRIFMVLQDHKGEDLRSAREEVFIERFRTLLETIESPTFPVENCELALLAPGFTRNVYIFGDRALYEGVKAGVHGGFHLTTRITDRAQIAARVEAFDLLFQDASTHSLESWGSSRRSGPGALRDAVLMGLRECQRAFANLADGTTKRMGGSRRRTSRVYR